MQLGRYRLVRELGRGATGIAYEAVDDRGAKLCVKIIHATMAANNEAMERVRREIVLTNRIRNPMVCHAFGLEVIEGHVVVAMELAEGASLAAILKARGTLPVDEVLALGVALSSALAAAHAVGVIHRDVKPGNVVVTPGGSVKLLDFGVATATDLGSTLTKPGALLGTRSYIAPEVWMGAPASTKSDQYAVGVVLYRALTGQLPYPQKDAVLLDAMMKSKPPSPRTLRADVPPLVDAMVLRILAARPEDRFEDMNALSLVLQQAKQQWLAFSAASTIVTQRPLPAPPSPSRAPGAIEEPPSTGPNLAVVESLLASASSSSSSPSSNVDAFDVKTTVDLPTAPVSAVSAAAGDEDASWVINGQAVGGHVQPKVMEVAIGGITSSLEPDELPIWKKDGSGRSFVAFAVAALVVVALAALWFFRMRH